MHHVLSFQMARGFGESSEFVTKRMCFSSLFCVSFLAVLGGFLLGRYAAERTVIMRDEKTRIELAGNGLENTGHLQHLLLQRLQDVSFENDYLTNSKEDDAQRIMGIFSNLQLVNTATRTMHRKPCIFASIRGSREPDRYIVLSASGEGAIVAIELARILEQIHNEYDWNPRRTLIFCIFLEHPNLCEETLSNHIRSKVLAYIAIDANVTQVHGHFVISGSDIIRSIIVQTAEAMSYSRTDSRTKDQGIILSAYEEENHVISCPRLTLDMPHASVSFVEENISSQGLEFSDKIHWAQLKALAQVIGLSIWRLSDSVILHWNAKHLNNTVNKALRAVDSAQYFNAKEQISAAINELVNNVENLNKRIDGLEKSKSLEVRMVNDLLMDLDRALLCPNREVCSQSHGLRLSTVSQKSSIELVRILEDMRRCYENANQILRDS